MSGVSLAFSGRRSSRHWRGGGVSMRGLSGFGSNLIDLRLSVLLIAALSLGGTSQEIWPPKILLILLSIGLIGWTLADPERGPLSSLIRPPIIFVWGLAALYVLYLIPLPPDLWTRLPGRDPVVEAYALIRAAAPSIDATLPWMTLSLSPEKTLGGLICLIPVAAMALIIGTSASRNEIRLSIDALILFALANIALAVVQSVLQISAVHPYEITNRGLATGLFSNANHFGLFIAMVIPFAWYRVYSRLIAKTDVVKGLDLMGPLSSIFLVLAIGAIGLAGSVAAIGLSVFAFFGSLAITFDWVKRSYLLGLGALALVILMLDLFVLHGLLFDLAGNFRSESEISRGHMTRTGLAMLREFGVAGVGPGAVPEAYTQFEDPARIRWVFVNQLHNDILQFMLEFGLAGALLCLAAAVSFIRMVWQSLGKPSKTRRPLIFALVAVLPLLHSGVDYPLRTLGIAVFFTYVWVLASGVRHPSH